MRRVDVPVRCCRSVCAAGLNEGTLSRIPPLPCFLLSPTASPFPSLSLFVSSLLCFPSIPPPSLSHHFPCRFRQVLAPYFLASKHDHSLGDDLADNRCKCVCPHNLNVTISTNTTVWLKEVEQPSEWCGPLVCPLFVS